MGIGTLIDAVQLIALRSVVKPDGDYFVRRICRWYSREFHTPLHEVEELPLDYVLTQYFESTFEDMEEDERQERIDKLLEPEGKRRERIYQEELEEMEMEEFARFTEEQAKLEAKEKNEQTLNVPIQPELAPIQLSNTMREAELIPNNKVNQPPPLPDIRFEFDPNLDVEDFDSFPAPPPKNKE